MNDNNNGQKVFQTPLRKPSGTIYFVSNQKDFNPNEIGDTVIFSSNPLSSKPVDEDQWKDEIKKKRNIAVLIHGYSDDYEKAKHFCSEVIRRTQSFYEYDGYICYLWPGEKSKFKYREAAEQADTEVPPKLLSIIEDLTLYVRNVDVYAHSMGCRVFLNTMKLAAAKAVNIHLRYAFLMAPAVGDETLEKGREYYKGDEKIQTTYIFYSKNDAVLHYIYPPAEHPEHYGALVALSDPRMFTNISSPIFHDCLRDAREDVDALGFDMPKKLPRNVIPIDCTQGLKTHGFLKGIKTHSAYYSSPFVFQKIRTILQK